MNTTAASATKAINVRSPVAKQALIDRAAQLSGKNRMDFILDASCEKAQEILADQTHLSLDKQALQRFNELVEAPLEDAEALRRLLSTPAPWER